MVKTILKSTTSRASTEKRVRGIKSRIKPNNSNKKAKASARKIQSKPFDINYYLT